MKNILSLLIVLVLAVACEQQTADYNTISAHNQYDDNVLREIADLQDRRDTDSLLTYFDHTEAKYREAAALAFGSVQDSNAVNYLNRLLNDSNTAVRIAAIYALGQTGTDSAQNSLLYSLHMEDTAVVKKEALEALGKCITQDNLHLLITYEPEDSLEIEGHSWGLYRATIRGVVSPEAISLAAGYLKPEHTFQTRLGAAHLMARMRDANISEHLDNITGSALHDKSEFVRMASALALKHAKEDAITSLLTDKIIKDPDYRVRISAIRAMLGRDSAMTRPALMNSLLDENVQVGVVAAQSLARLLTDDDTQQLEGELLKDLHWRVRAILLGGMLAVDDKNKILIENINMIYDTATNIYERAAIISAMGNSALMFERVVSETFDTKQKVVSTSGISALANIRRQEDFPDELKDAFADILREACLSGDLAMIGTAASILINPDYGYKDHYDSVEFLYAAKEKLSLPKDNEGLQSLQRAIDYFEGNESPDPVTNTYNHPIDWDLVKTIDTNQRMKITTAKGDITMELIVDDAPGSVANFVQLAADHYYDGKNFHRVVSNFVVQGGCNRGDGWGGEDYSIRSEFAPLHYKEGYIGMASAGKDTEGTQWFITHSPTPHLDGGYTIFARVVEGMDIVHQLGVGDEIVSISLQNNVE